MRPLILALWFSVLSIAVIAVSGDAEVTLPACDQALQKSTTLLTWKQREGEPSTVLVWVEETLSTISNIDSEIAVVSITGPQRSGKSYLLNRLAKRISQRSSDPASPPREWEDPFDTFTTVEAGKGDVSVYIIPGCANPLPDRPGTALLLVDTPEMRTLQRSALQDAQVMALVEAVSSVVLYNTFSVVERTDFQLLSTALETSRALDVLYAIDHGSEENIPESHEQKPGMINRPGLVWLLQQPTLKPFLADKDDPAASAKYYVDHLLENAWDGETFKNAFNGFFTEWEVAALPKPLTNAESWPVLNTILESDLSDEYKNSEESVVETILKACAPKTLDDAKVVGKDLGDFLREFSEAVNVQTDDENVESPTVLLEALEDQELDIATEDFKKIFEPKLPLGSVDLDETRKYAEKLLWSRSNNPRSPEESQPDSSSLRRAAFVKKFHDLMAVAYKGTCETNALTWSITEVAALKEEFGDLERPKTQSSHPESRAFTLPPNHEDVMEKFVVRETRWKEDIADTISRSHKDFESKDSDFVKGGKFTDYHLRELKVATDDFLGESLADVKQKASEWFRDELDLRKHLADEATLDDVGHLAEEAKELAKQAFSMVLLAVGFEEAEKVKADEGWEDSALTVGNSWLKARGGSGKVQGPDVEVKDVDDQEDDLEQEKADARAKRLVDDYERCILEIKPDDSQWGSSMKSCRSSVNDQWKTPGADPSVLNERVDKVEERHIKSYLKVILQEEVDDHVPLYKQTRDMHEQAVNAREDKKGMLADLKSDSRLKDVPKEVIDDVWTKKCGEAGKEHIKKAKAATSIFSLAPLRYFGPAPFQPADCLKGEARVRAAEDAKKARSWYYRGSWLRRYIVTLSLVCTFILTLVAVALLVAGRQLQHSQVAMAFVAATAFHVIVLCLAVSDGLVRGTRLWLLVSAGLLGYVASGSTVSMVGGKRGRGSTRYPVWSAVGIRRWTGFSDGGSLMPLFRDSGVSGRGTKVSRERDSRARHTD